MNFGNAGSIIGVLLVLLIVSAATALFYQSSAPARQVAQLTPKPTANPHISVTPNPNITAPQLSPTPATSLEGTIASVSAQPVAYKNALVAKVQQNTTTQIPLYVSPQTKVYDINGNLIDRSKLVIGMKITAKGNPTEGGIEISTLKILSKP